MHCEQIGEEVEIASLEGLRRTWCPDFAKTRIRRIYALLVSIPHFPTDFISSTLFSVVWGELSVIFNSKYLHHHASYSPALFTVDRPSSALSFLSRILIGDLGLRPYSRHASLRFAMPTMAEPQSRGVLGRACAPCARSTSSTLL